MTMKNKRKRWAKRQRQEDNKFTVLDQNRVIESTIARQQQNGATAVNDERKEKKMSEATSNGRSNNNKCTANKQEMK